ncbi:hypothetical protein CF319_g9328, partial [Tilletia indica]
PLTGAVRRRPKTPKFTVRDSKSKERLVEKTYSGAGSVHRDQGPLATVTDPAGASGLRLGNDKTALTSRAFSQCVNTRILGSQGPEDTRI